MSIAAQDITHTTAREHSRTSIKAVLPKLWIGALLLILMFLVVYPVSMLGYGAVTTGNPLTGTGTGELSIANFLNVLSDPAVGRATLNSLIICGGGTVIAVFVGLMFSWITVRTNTPLRRVIEITGMLPLFVPPLVAAFAWGLLASPRTGLINVALNDLGIPFTVNFYSLYGMIFIFGIYYAPYVFMFTASALKNMDPSLEEAAEISGVGPFRTLFTITFPLIMPAILSGTLLAFVVMLGIYGIPAALGTPAQIPVLTTYIYGLISWSPPNYNAAAATSIILIAVTALCVFLQQHVLKGRSYVTVSGKSFRPKQLDLGKWKWATFTFAMMYLMVGVVLPTLALIIASFRNFLYLPSLASIFDMSAYSWGHYERLFANPLTWRSVVNTFEIGIITAVVGGALAFALCYTIYRTTLPGRRLLDVLSTLPVAIPGLVVGVAYIWAWIGLPIGLYGTVWILALAFVARFLPDTVKSLSTSLMQIHKDLEEASFVAGTGLLQTIRRIILPLIMPGLVSSMSLLFILAIRELGSSLFLYVSDTIPMAVLLLDFFEGGNTGVTAAFSLVQTLLLIAVIGFSGLVGRYFSTFRK
jgi:iron(III) transport system permease protein